MFSGIVEELGIFKRKLKKRDITKLEIENEKIIEKLKPGDSIAVNGVCLTVEEIKGKSFYVSITEFTEKETNLGNLRTGDIVNLETPLKAGDKISGHFLTGHVDFKTKILSFSKSMSSGKIILYIPGKYRKYFAEKGSVAVDGISLTIAKVLKDRIEINIIPYTIEHTNLKRRKTGEEVNIEIDLMIKYIERIIGEKYGRKSILND